MKRTTTIFEFFCILYIIFVQVNNCILISIVHLETNLMSYRPLSYIVLLKRILVDDFELVFHKCNLIDSYGDCMTILFIL